MANPTDDSVGTSSQLRKRKQTSSEVISSFGSLSEFGESNIGSGVNGDQETMFSFGTTTTSVTAHGSTSRSPAPKPTSCCLSEPDLSGLSRALIGASSTSISGSNFGAETSPTSNPSSSGTGFKNRLVSNPSRNSDSHLPRKKRALGRPSDPSGSSTQPSTDLTLGNGDTSPFGSLTTLSHGSMFSPNHPVPSFGSSQPSPFSSWSTQSTTFGNVAGPSGSGGQVEESRMVDVRSEDGDYMSVSAQPEFSNRSHEELRWEVYRQGYNRAPMFCALGSITGFFQFPGFAFGSFPFAVPCTVSADSGQTSAQPSHISTPLHNQSNTALASVPSIGFGQQFLLVFPPPTLDSGFRFRFDQTIPDSASPTTNNAPPPIGPNGSEGN